jgi:hypothetical protein
MIDTRADYDSPWKEAIELYFWESMAFFVQSQYQAEFAQRMYVYNYRLRVGFSLYAVRIATIVQWSAWASSPTIAPAGDRTPPKPASWAAKSGSTFPW